jgi:8-oxo-dGTP diphosphatase
MAQSSDIIQRVATKAVIADETGRLLLLREAKTYADGTNIGKYHFPGGRLEPGEVYQDGLRREVMEETGLSIEIGKPLYVGEWHPNIRGVVHQIVAIFFVCTSLGRDVRLSSEHDDYIWLDPSETDNYPIMVPDDKVVDAYVRSAC